MKILVTGAAGTVGRCTIEELTKIREIEIIATDLNTSNNRKILAKFRNKIKIKLGDLLEDNFIDEISKSIDFTIHLAAIIPPLADEKPQLARKVNVCASEKLIRALEKNSPNSFFVYCSSISVYGDRLSAPFIRVTDRLCASVGDHYAETKIETEKIVQHCQLNWTVFRLTAVFGYGNHKISKLMFHMPLKTPIEIITPEDAGRAFAFSTKHLTELNKKVYNLSGGEDCRILYEDFLKKSFHIYGLKKFLIPKTAFAQKNFHCAFVDDGDELENILHFRNDNINDYFQKNEQKIGNFVKFWAGIFSPIYQKILVNKSEPLKALKNFQIENLRRFFGNKISLD